MMAALRDCMLMTSWLVLTMYFCFFCLTCRYVIEGPGGKIFSIISFIIGGTVIAMDTGESTAGVTVGEGLQYYLLKEIPTDNQLYIDAETKKFFEVG
jgi:hypothetical protein